MPHLTTLAWVILAVIFVPTILIFAARLLALLFAAVMMLLRQDPESRERRLLRRL